MVILVQNGQASAGSKVTPVALFRHAITALQPISNVATFKPDTECAELTGSGDPQRTYPIVAVGEVWEI